MKILKDRRSIKVECTDNINDIQRYAFGAYGFLLPIGKSTTQEFAELIKKTYSLANPRNKAVYDAVLAIE